MPISKNDSNERIMLKNISFGNSFPFVTDRFRSESAHDLMIENDRLTVKKGQSLSSKLTKWPRAMRVIRVQGEELLGKKAGRSKWGCEKEGRRLADDVGGGLCQNESYFKRFQRLVLCGILIFLHDTGPCPRFISDLSDI